MIEELHGSLTIKPPYGKALPRPKDADLNKAEKAIGAKLPAAFRAYAKLFGMGEHGGYFRIFVPLGPKFPRADLASHTAEYRKGFADRAKTSKDKEVFLRMIPFADNTGGDIFFFDPGAAKGKDTNYPVYAQIHGHDRIVKAAGDFSGFLSGIVYKRGGLEKLTRSKAIMEPIREFTPYGDKVRGL